MFNLSSNLSICLTFFIKSKKNQDSLVRKRDTVSNVKDNIPEASFALSKLTSWPISLDRILSNIKISMDLP